MSLVIEESKEILKELVSCILQSVRKNKMESISIIQARGESNS
jgi:hypothetical protein